MRRKSALNLKQLDAYIHGGQYEQDVTVIVLEAMKIVEAAIKHNVKPKIIVMDIDETILSNASYILANKELIRLNHVHHGLHKEEQDAFKRLKDWQYRSQCTLIDPMVAFYAWLLEKPVSVVFLTARTLDLKAATERNLKLMNLPLSPVLYRDIEQWPISTLFKSAMRQSIVESGSDIILNIGDQPGDFEGGCWQEALYVPNPFYQTDSRALY